MRSKITFRKWDYDTRTYAALAVGVLLLVAVAYFLNRGAPGLYADDWVFKFFGSGLARTTWTPQVGEVQYRVLGIWLAPILANLLPTLETPIYLARIGIHLLNVILLGWLAVRLTGSAASGILTGALFLVPLFAYEALFWFTAGVFYLIPLSLLLLGFHAILSCHSLRSSFYLPIAAVAAWCAMLMFIEGGLMVPLLTAPMVWILRRREVSVDRRAWMGALFAFYLAAGLYVWNVLRSSPIVAVHGETTMDPTYILTRRVPELAQSLSGYFVDWLPRGLYADALDLGTREMIATPLGWILALALLATLITLIWGIWWSSPESVPSNSLLLAGLGAAWFVLALVPVLLIQDLAISSRVMLLPSAGSALFGAGVCLWLVSLAKSRRRLAWAIVAVAIGIFLLVNTLAMSGIGKVYALRWERDQLQFNAFRSSLPEMPAKKVYVMAHALDETIVEPRLGRRTQLDDMLYGLFDIQWAAEPALWLAYQTEQISTVSKDVHGRIHITGVELNGRGVVKSLSFRGAGPAQTIPPARLIAFTHRGGNLYWLHPLLLSQDDESPPIQVPLPLIDALTSAPKREAKMGIESAQ